MQDYRDGDFREVDEKGEPIDGVKSDDRLNKEDGSGEVCYICGCPGSMENPLIRIEPGKKVCSECMQLTFDTMGGILSGNGSEEIRKLVEEAVTALNPTENPTTGFVMPADAQENAGDDAASDDNAEDAKAGAGKDTSKNSQQGGFFGPFGLNNIGMISMQDLQNMLTGAAPVKKKVKSEKSSEPVIDIRSVPAPHKIKEKLDEFVVGQEQAKKIMSVAVYNHYKRVATNTMDDIEIEKSNMLMIGPTGCGKTYLVKTLARLLDVPLAIADATSLTEAGYIGDDIESVLSKLLAAADNDVERAECGIVFIDEIDKIAKKKNTNQRDVSGESVQQGMLKLLEGSEVEVPVGSNSKNAMVPMATIDTKNILFICGGAFPDLEDIIKERLNKESSIGFKADLKDKYDDEPNLLLQVKVEDVRNYGMIPEFLGRMPVLFAMETLDEDMMARILTEPKNAIIKQYQKLLALDEVDLVFEPDAIREIARLACEKDVGARALRAIIEEFMLDIMYEIPKDDAIGRVIITKEYIEKKGGPRIILRGSEEDAQIPQAIAVALPAQSEQG